MKKISIIGVGMGPSTTTQEGMTAIQEADALIGARRMTEMFPTEKPVFHAFSREETSAAVSGTDAQRIAVLVSGDAGFYSAAEGLVAELRNCDIEVLPGISSLNYFFSRLRRPWQNASLISCHGRNANLADTVRRSRLTFALTGGNAAQLAERLTAAGFGGLTVTVGEDLGSDGERITRLTAAQLAGADVSPLAVLLVENPDFDDRVRTGIPDEEFHRGSVPMTKAEVRAVILSRLRVRPSDICWDIGCGTGSVTVEMALAAYRGHVYAMDKSRDAIALTESNCTAFHIGNVTAALGSAPRALSQFPAPDAAFIGGSGGDMGDIVSHILTANPRARIVVSAIALESVNAAIRALKENAVSPEVLQIASSRAKETAGLHMLTANNPIFILSGGGHE